MPRPNGKHAALTIRRRQPEYADRPGKKMPFRVFQLQGNGWRLLAGVYEQAAAEKVAGQNSGRVKVLDRYDRELAVFSGGRRVA